MCGRFTLKTNPSAYVEDLFSCLGKELDEPTQEILAQWSPRYNVAPTQQVLAVFQDRDSQAGLGFFRWGLIPFWSEDLRIGNRMINARSETLLEKRSFKTPLAKRRCLVLTDGYYEWQKQADGSKLPYWISPQAEGIFAFAGLWESNSKATGEPVNSCTIITAAANKKLAPIHDRMPAIMDTDNTPQWLSPSLDAESAAELLTLATDDYFTFRPVNKAVGNPRFDSESIFN